MIRRLGNWLRGESIFVVVGLALIAGLATGLGLWGSFNLTAAATSSDAYCTSCHEMLENAKEYESTVHYMNVFGIRAHCADCHVPKPFVPHVIDMVLALRDVVGHVTGVIDTPAKFEAHRKEMAERVWSEMEADNSIGCRSCHSFEAMDFAKQPKVASMAMHPAMQAGMTCISCHKGIVHDLP
jgi:nitrate/TMAO reductase-like tetraheme cytochrome c subunit